MPLKPHVADDLSIQNEREYDSAFGAAEVDARSVVPRKSERFLHDLSGCIGWKDKELVPREGGSISNRVGLATALTLNSGMRPAADTLQDHDLIALECSHP